VNGLVIFVMAGFAIGIGFVTGSPVPVGIAGVLVAAYIFSLLTSRGHLSRLSVERETDGQMIEVGASILARLRIHSQGAVPFRWMLVRDRIPKGVIVDSPTGRLSFGSGFESQGFFYKATFPSRGIFDLGPAELSSGDLLATREVTQVDDHALTIVVHPRIVPMVAFRLPSSRPFGDLRADPKSHEDPTRPSGCRPYAYGDPMKRIHWPATARTGALLSRLYDGSSSPVTAVIVDQSTDSYPDEASFELACCVAASILACLLRDGAEAGLVGPGLKADSGDLHLERCLASLAGLTLSFQSFADQLLQFREELPWRPSLIVVTSKIDERGAAALEIIRSAGGTIALAAVGADDEIAQQSMGLVVALGGSVMRIRKEVELESGRFISANER
jgi:uncharacterized protein (DUF58 family)